MGVLERVAAAMEDEETGFADNLIWMLQERNFMLAYMGDHQYAFVDRTFPEYSCARDLKYRLENKTTDFTIGDLRRVYREGWPRDEWHEALRLLSGLIGPEHAGACAGELLQQQNREDSHQAVVLAAQVLLEVRQDGARP